MVINQQNLGITTALRSAVSNIDMIFEGMILNNHVNKKALEDAALHIQDAIDHADGKYEY